MKLTDKIHVSFKTSVQIPYVPIFFYVVKFIPIKTTHARASLLNRHFLSY